MRHYELFIDNNCRQCDHVVDFLRRKEINCLIINVDDEGDNPPTPVFVYPALFMNGKLAAYGLDIVEHFQLNENRP